MDNSNSTTTPYIQLSYNDGLSLTGWNITDPIQINKLLNFLTQTESESKQHET